MNQLIDELSEHIATATKGRFTTSEVSGLDECKAVLETLVTTNEKRFQETNDKLAAIVARAQAARERLAAAPPLTAQAVDRLAGTSKGLEVIEMLRSEINHAVTRGLSHNSYQIMAALDVIAAIEQDGATLAKDALRVLDTLVRTAETSRDPEPVQEFMAQLQRHQVVQDDAEEEAFAAARHVLQQIAEDRQHKIDLEQVIKHPRAFSRFNCFNFITQS